MRKEKGKRKKKKEEEEEDEEEEEEGGGRGQESVICEASRSQSALPGFENIEIEMISSDISPFTYQLVHYDLFTPHRLNDE